MDNIHQCGCDIWAFELRSGARAQVGRSSSGAGAAGGWGWLVVVVVLVDPVWRVRQEWVVVGGGLLDADAARWGVHGFLELTYEWLDSSVPQSGIRGFEVLDQFRDVTPDWVSGDVRVHCPGEV